MRGRCLRWVRKTAAQPSLGKLTPRCPLFTSIFNPRDNIAINPPSDDLPQKVGSRTPYPIKTQCHSFCGGGPGSAPGEVSCVPDASYLPPTKSPTNVKHKRTRYHPKTSSLRSIVCLYVSVIYAKLNPVKTKESPKKGKRLLPPFSTPVIYPSCPEFDDRLIMTSRKTHGSHSGRCITFQLQSSTAPSLRSQADLYEKLNSIRSCSELFRT
ncbi:hypothetical protein B0J14DRAFT_609724 [Halenospora varia]|nr:hypothetical protein B0J14DRAFT_609724 [Halenospora varia]